MNTEEKIAEAKRRHLDLDCKHSPGMANLCLAYDLAVELEKFYVGGIHPAALYENEHAKNEALRERVVELEQHKCGINVVQDNSAAAVLFPEEEKEKP